jgi:hypothetical protein
MSNNQFSQDANLAFDWQWENIPAVIEFNPKWSNGTGYFDHAVQGEDAPLVVPGTAVKTQDTFGRKIIIVGMPKRLGNVVIFERYRSVREGEQVNDRSPIVHNSPRLLKYVLTNNNLTADDIRSLWDFNTSDLYNMAAGFARLYGHTEPA